MSCGDAGDIPGEVKAEALMPRRKNVRRVDRGMCQRCREAKSKFIVRSATYCRTCFEGNVFSRFTRQLYPPLHPPHKERPTSKNLYRPGPKSGNVAVACSGGAGSMCMLDMLMSGGYVGDGSGYVADKTKGERDVIWQQGWVIYVEFAGVIEGGEDRTEWMRDMAKSRGFGFVGLRAEDVFDEGLNERLGGKAHSAGQSFHVDLKDTSLPISTQASSSVAPLEKLRNLLTSLPPPSRPALLSNILNSLIHTATANLPNISHLLLGETATRQSQRVISATASGRGWALPLELSGALTLPSGIVRISPMKDLSVKEAAFACKLRGVEMRNWRDWDKAGLGAGDSKRDARGKGGAMSIEGLTEQFIAALNVTHPATVSTITRTGDKLVFPGGSEREKLCPLCQMPVDPSALEWKARTGLTSLGKQSPTADDKSVSPPDTSASMGLAPSLCYSCLTTMTPITHRKDPVADDVELPIWVGQRVAVGRDEMKAEMKGFLLDDEE